MRGHFSKRWYVDKKTGERRQSSTWSVLYDLPRVGDEPRKQKIKSGFRTRKDAEAWFNRKVEQLRQGVAPHDDRMTLAEYLTDWITVLEGPTSRVKAPALRAYRNHVNGHIIPAIGSVRLSELHAGHIEAAKAKWGQTAPVRGKDDVISARTVRHIFATLKSALNRAKRQRIIAVNPCELVDAPAAERKEMQALDIPAAAALLRAFEGTVLDAPVITAIGTGLRRGELLALRWSDVDLSAGTLTVNRAIEHENGKTRFKEPKTKRSRRTINLPPFVTERLRRHRVEQAERFLSDGLGRPIGETLLFERAGEPWVPNTFGTAFWRVLDDAKLPHIRVHDLRHSFASMALEAGVDLKTVSTALGHTTISTTADLYAHVTSSLLKDAAERIDGALGAALRRKRA